jgi:hypothetical protein
MLTDGRVLVSGPERSNNWYTLTPDAAGSYQNGKWTSLGTSPLGRLFHPGFILRDGRYWTGGGEYLTTGTDYAESEIFDPTATTNPWSVAPDMPMQIADTPAAMLANGQILVLSRLGPNSYLFNSFGTLPNWTAAAPWSSTIGDSESSSLLLPDGSVIVGTRQFQRYLPGSPDTWVNTALPPGGMGALANATTDEMGPMVLLHDGRALVLGANSHNGLYTVPAVATDPGTWTMAADTPPPYNHGDAPSLVEPDGMVLSVVTADPSGIGAANAVFYEYDPTADTWTPVDTPFSFSDSERVSLLCLPNGQVWVSGQGSANAWLYTPAGTSQSAWRPTLTSITPGVGEFTVSGTQLNGLTTGGDFGDDGKMATNFPVAWLTDGAGNVNYARSYNFDQMAPRPGMAGSFVFAVPNSLADGTYTLHASANGVEAANTLPITFSGLRAISLTGISKQSPGALVFTKVTLSGAAPAGGATVNLASTDPTVATVPASVTVPAGSTWVNFYITTTGYGKTTIKAATAANPGFSASKSFGWSVASLSGPATAPGSATATWTVGLDSTVLALSGSVVVNLQSSNPAVATVPATVTVVNNTSTATFPVTVVNPAAGSTTITASLIGSSKSGNFGYSILGVNGAAVPQSGTTTPWAVFLNDAAPAGGVVVNLQSSNPAAATVPATVTVPSGSSTGFFTVTLVSAQSGPTTITGSMVGSSGNGTFGYQVQSVTGPAVPATGTTATWTATLNGAAPAGGVVLSLQSSNPAGATVPPTVTVPAGASSATFSVTMVSPTALRSTITAALGSSSQSGTFGYAVQSLSIPSTIIPVGGTSTATVTLNGNAPTGGLLITPVTSDPTRASVPASITIPEGASTGTFLVTGVGPGVGTLRARVGTAGALSPAVIFRVN